MKILTRPQISAIECEALKRLKASHLAALDEIDRLRAGARANASGMLTARDLAEKLGITSARIRQIATTIPGAKKTGIGWLFPEHAADNPPFKKMGEP